MAWAKMTGSYPGVFLGKGVRKICGKFTGEHPCRRATSIKLLCIFSEYLWRTASGKNVSEYLEFSAYNILRYILINKVIHMEVKVMHELELHGSKFINAAIAYHN